MTLPAPDVRQRVLHPNPLPELLSAFRRLLALPQLLQQTLVGMDAHAPASVLALGASRSQGTRCANLLREAHHPANLEGHRDTRRAAQQPSLPVQSEGRLRVTSRIGYPPRFGADPSPTRLRGTPGLCAAPKGRRPPGGRDPGRSPRLRWLPARWPA